MTQQQRKLWTEAYKLAHVCADQTERALDGKNADADWLRSEAKNLLHAVKKLKSTQYERHNS